MSSKIATRESYGKALKVLATIDKNVVVLDADLSKSTKTADFKSVAPERFFNMGIAEANMMVVAAGMATCGKIPYVSTFAMFAAGRAFEQIRNSICYPKLNVKICATHAGVTVGEDGASHQAIEDISLMRSIPETEAAIKAIADIKGPCYVRLGRMPVATVNNKETYKFELGKGVKLAEGTDVTIVATGIMVEMALEAKEVLSKEGISAKVINIHTIKPIDKSILIDAAKGTGAIVTAEEHSIIGGLGSAVSEVVCEEYPVPVLKVGVMDVFGQSGKPDELLKEYGLTVSNIVEKVKKAIALKSSK
jgi:transketolase